MISVEPLDYSSLVDSKTVEFELANVLQGLSSLFTVVERGFGTVLDRDDGSLFFSSPRRRRGSDDEEDDDEEEEKEEDDDEKEVVRKRFIAGIDIRDEGLEAV